MKISTDVVLLNYQMIVLRLEKSIEANNDQAYAAEKENLRGILQYMDEVGYEFADAPDGSLTIIEAK